MRIGKDFATSEWVHVGCLFRKMHATAVPA